MRAATAATAAAVVLLVSGTATACASSARTGDSASGVGPSATARTPAAASSSPSPSPSRPLPSPSSPGTPAGPLAPAAQRYLDAVAAGDADAVAAAFDPDAVVIDVGREIRGRDAIRRWAAVEVVGGVYTLLGHTPRAGGTTMLVRFRPGGSGGFRARYDLDIADGLITRADLRYA
ncbi:nuclear transport factor 2 family protein [Streptomyces sp. NK15101]|uniref:nuclear transport factor 2 family protein n=1 Tax=Streptomyces sp. NK15101 TaxID=2873261 RepID=UPI001CED8F68|nr:nuclear transport factor 2 family protein [Streptomyces sp. NK15101]